MGSCGLRTGHGAGHRRELTKLWRGRDRRSRKERRVAARGRRNGHGVRRDRIQKRQLARQRDGGLHLLGARSHRASRRREAGARLSSQDLAARRANKDLILGRREGEGVPRHGERIAFVTCHMPQGGRVRRLCLVNKERYDKGDVPLDGVVLISIGVCESA